MVAGDVGVGDDLRGGGSASHSPNLRTAISSFSTVAGASVSRRAASHLSATACIRGGSTSGGFQDGISLRGWVATWPAVEQHHLQLVQMGDPLLGGVVAVVLRRGVEAGAGRRVR